MKARHLALPLLAAAVTAAGPAAASAAVRSELSAPFLWQVDGGERPSFLFGTVHAGVDASELPPVVTGALDDSEVFVMETDLGRLDRARLIAAGTAPPPHDLKELVGDRWPELVSALGDPPDDHVRRLLPWLAAMLVMQGGASAATAAEPLDAALADRARDRGLAIAHLEAPGFQLATLARTTGLADLLGLLDSAERGVDPDLLDAYRRGDLEALVAGTRPPIIRPDHHELLFTARNRRWAAKLAPALARGGLFVAAGAGHFGGEDGLLELLRTRGYLSRRVPSHA